MSTLFKWLMVLASGYTVPTELINNNQIMDQIFMNGSGVKTNAVVDFYVKWHSVLHTNILAVQKIVGTLNGWILLGLYHTVQALESVFMAVLKLFGFFANFNVGEMGTLYKTIVLLGFALLTIGLGYLLVENIFRAKTKLHEVVTNLVVVIAILVMLPFGTNLFSQFVMAGSQDIVGAKGSDVTNIALQPVKNNVVDTIALSKLKFNVNPDKLDGQMAKYNGIEANTMNYLGLSEVIASDNLKTNATPKGVDNVFKHRLTMGAETNGYSIEGAVLPSSQLQITKAFSAVYPRYTGHFVIADLQLLLLACMFGLIAFRVGKSWFEILILNASAPLMGFQDLRTNQRLKEVMQAIQGSFIGIFAEMIGLRLFLIALDYLGSADNPGVAFLKQYPNSALPIGFFLVIMYLSCFVAFMSGVSLIERWTGVPQSKNRTALGALMGLGLGITAAGKGIKAGAAGLSKAGADTQGHAGKVNKALDSATGTSTLPDPTKVGGQQAGQATVKPNAMGATERDDTVTDQATWAPNSGLATQNAGADSAAAPDETSSQIDDQSVSTASPSDSAAGSASSSASGSDQPTPELTTPTSDEGLPDPTTLDKETGSQAKTVDGLPDPTAGVMPASSASSDNGTTGLAKEAGQTSDELNTLPDPTAGVTASNGTSAEPASWDHEAEGDLNGTQPRPNPTAGVTIPSSGDQSTPTVGAEVSSADRPEGLAREDGASEPMPQPAHGDQVNKGVIPEGVISNGLIPKDNISDYEEDEREVFERPVDEQPEWPGDHQSGSVNDGAPSDRTTTPPQSSHEVKSASGKQPVVSNGPERAAGKHLIKSGSMMTAAAREHGNDEQSMVNLPEIKIDDSIY